MSSTKNIFAIYASQDIDVLQYLLLHLQPLNKDFDIAIWSDDAINPGQLWKPRNVSRLDHADVFLLLLSNTFMHSEFIKQDEFKMVMDRYKEGKATVIPILLDDCPWDVEFTSDDYNFNFRELQVFPKDEKPIGDWNSTDEVFKQVAYYVRVSLTSSAKKSNLEETTNKGGKKILNTKKQEQIAIDFFEEREANNKAERERKRKKEAEAKKRVEENNKHSEEAEAKEVISEVAEAKEVIRKEKRLRQKAEIQKRIEKEKSLKEKAKKDKKNEEEANAKSVVQDEIQGNEEIKAQMAEAEKRSGELEKAEREVEQEKRLGEVVMAQKSVMKKNGLAEYNYQFKTAKVVEANSVVQEERRVTEEANAQKVEAEKRHVEITKPEVREPAREKKLGEEVAVKEKVMLKNGLAAYNYQFTTAKTVDAKSVDYEQRRGHEQAKVQKGVTVKKRFELIKSEIETALKKRLAEVVSALKSVMKKNSFARKNYQFKNATSIDQIPNEESNKKTVNTIRRVHPRFLIAALVICGLMIYVFTRDSEKQPDIVSESETAEVASEADIQTSSVNQAGGMVKLVIGDPYEGGIIFKIDPSNKKGKIAYSKDSGPMSWKKGMTIHEQLGDGWRLPTLNELQLMYQTIGQGANNSGQFTGELYWSATSFDENQARLLKFSSGNSSYHFNSTGTHRQFRVRAIQDFNR